MNDASYAKRCIALLRPLAKFVSHSHSSAFIDASAELGDGFHYVGLYDEKIDSNVINGPRGLILIHNTYLSSFAYNLFLCWLWCAERPQESHASPGLPALLTHNFKKFFAEQLLHNHNGLFARAIFLETLLYEQSMMIPVFHAKSQDADLNRKAGFGASIMSSLVVDHELGHFVLKRDARQWDELVARNSDVLAQLYHQAVELYPAAFVEEFKCDVLAVLSCIQQHEAEVGREFCVRAIVFAFSAFAVLSSLAKSADQTSGEQRKVPETVKLGSIEKIHRDFEYTLGFDLDFVERARLMIMFCDNMMQAGGSSLFIEDRDFSLPSSILDDLMGYIDRIMLSNDQNARSMSLLVAEALHENPRGLDHLYLRSKTFSFSNDVIPLDHHLHGE